MKPLPDNFRHIRLELAREPGHPVGDRAHGYDILLPLDEKTHIDAATFKAHSGACRVRRFRPGENDAIGLLAHGPGGRWYFDYDEDRDTDNEPGFRFDEEVFVVGEYISVREDDGDMHTFQIISVDRL